MPPLIADALILLLAPAIAAAASSAPPAPPRVLGSFGGEARPECVRARAMGWDCCSRSSAQRLTSRSLPPAQRPEWVEPLSEGRHP